jgi:hypothetical protein
MKLRLIYTALNEGIYIKGSDGQSTGYEDLTLTNLMGDAERGIKKMNTRSLTPLYSKPTYAYREENLPSDLVHVYPLDKSVLTKIPYTKIYYAFAVVPSEDFMDQTLEPEFGPDTDYSINKSTNEWINKVRIAVRDEFGSTSSSHSALFAFSNSPAKPKINSMQVLDMMVSGDRKFSKAAKDAAKNLIQQLEKHNTVWLADIEKEISEKFGSKEVKHRGAEATASGTRKRSMASIKITREAAAKEHLRYASVALAKKLKQPSNADEQRMADKLTDMSVRMLIRKFKPFDFIVRPESSSSYNDKLVNLIKSQSGWENMQDLVLNKRLGKDLQGDLTALKPENRTPGDILYSPEEEDEAKEATLLFAEQGDIGKVLEQFGYSRTITMQRFFDKARESAKMAADRATAKRAGRLVGERRGGNAIKLADAQRILSTGSQLGFDMSKLQSQFTPQVLSQDEIGPTEEQVIYDPDHKELAVDRSFRVNELWVNLWAVNKICQVLLAIQQQLNVKPQIKQMTAINQVKELLDLFSIDVEPKALAGKRVLIVDDNVDNQSTMVICKRLIEEYRPREIIMFTPFYMRVD